jgi:uncharacterized membrane protein YbhN (UPF0104 family)
MLLAPLCPVVPVAGPLPRQLAVTPATPASKGKARALPAFLALGAAVLGIGLLVVELCAADPAAMLRSLHAGWVVAALGCTTASLLAAAHNLHGFATVPLRTGTTLRAQLAIGFTRVLMPSALSTPAVASRYLNRSGAPWPAALGTVSAAQLVQLIMTAVIVGVLSLTSSGAHLHVQPSTLAAVGGSVLGATIVAALIARRSKAVRAALRGAAASWATLRRHAGKHPGRIAAGTLAAAALTGAHILAFACCVYAVGGHAAALALAVVYLASSAAGSLVPTPGGTGAAEAALVAGLTAVGLPLPVAAAAALLSRLESVWLPAVPGLWALRSMRRDGLL